MARLFPLYMNLLKTHPIKTQAISTGILMTAGDVISQLLAEKKVLFKDFSFERSSRFMIYGTCVFGPILHQWYVLLEKKITRPPPIGLFTKIALDQIIFCPLVLLAFLGTMTLWSTHSLQKTKEKFKKDYMVILINGYKLWPAVQLVNFYFIPLHIRVVFVNSIALFWNIYLAYKAAN